ncbi:MFS transporter, partial [Enterococcus faecium]
WGVLAVAIACGAIFVCLIVQFDPRRWVIGIGIMIVILSAFMYGWPILGLLPTYLTGAGYAASTVANLLT